MNNENLWQQGCITIPVRDTELVKAQYLLKVHNEPVKYGIEGGRISKLDIRINDKVTCCYDLGWIIKPVDDDQHTMIALSVLMLQNW